MWAAGMEEADQDREHSGPSTDLQRRHIVVGDSWGGSSINTSQVPAQPTRVSE